MGRLLYNLVLHLGIVLLGPFLVVGLIFSQKRRASILKRLGIILPHVGKQAQADGHIWIHALSVGEFRSAEPLINRMAEKYGGSKLVLTTSTVTGQKLAQNRYGAKVNAIGYFPYDIPWAIDRILQRIYPQLVVLVESDLWPNFMAAVNSRKIPIVWANARISDKSFKGYRRFGIILTPMFNQFDAVGAQTAGDAEKLDRLGVIAEKVSVTGNIKFDQPAPETGAEWIRRERQKLGWPDTVQVVVAGSTHAGEEVQIIEGFEKILRKRNSLGLMVVPRDPNRAQDVVRIGIETGCKSVLYSDLNGNGAPPDIVVVDRMGLLRDLYALADIAFVGGSLVPLGGHNPIEPAALGKPLLWGPHMYNFTEMAGAFISQNAAHVINGPEEFEQRVLYWLSEPEASKTAGEAALELVRQNRGSAEKIMEIIAELYDV